MVGLSRVCVGVVVAFVLRLCMCCTTLVCCTTTPGAWDAHEGCVALPAIARPSTSAVVERARGMCSVAQGRAKRRPGTPPGVPGAGMFPAPAWVAWARRAAPRRSWAPFRPGIWTARSQLDRLPAVGPGSCGWTVSGVGPSHTRCYVSDALSDGLTEEACSKCGGPGASAGVSVRTPSG